MSKPNLVLEVRTNIPEARGEIETVKCGYCDKVVPKKTAYQSPSTQAYYCNQGCLVKFTED